MRVHPFAAAAAVSAALLGALVWLWSDTDRYRWTEPRPLPPALDEVVAVDRPEPPEVSRYRETLERPLFAAGRRIGPRGGSAEQTVADSLNDVRLLGTYAAGGSGGIVVVRAGKVERIPVGASIGGWKVAGEDGRGAALERSSGERRKLEMALNSETAAPAGAAAKPDARPAPAQSAPGVARPPAAPRPAQVPAQRPPPGAASAGDPGMQEAIRQRLERVNARRAKQGLPPLTE